MSSEKAEKFFLVVKSGILFCLDFKKKFEGDRFYKKVENRCKLCLKGKENVIFAHCLFCRN